MTAMSDKWKKYEGKGNPAFLDGLRFALLECEREASFNDRNADTDHEMWAERARGASTCAQYIRDLLSAAESPKKV